MYTYKHQIWQIKNLRFLLILIILFFANSVAFAEIEKISSSYKGLNGVWVGKASNGKEITFEIKDNKIIMIGMKFTIKFKKLCYLPPQGVREMSTDFWSREIERLKTVAKIKNDQIKWENFIIETRFNDSKIMGTLYGSLNAVEGVTGTLDVSIIEPKDCSGGAKLTWAVSRER